MSNQIYTRVEDAVKEELIKIAKRKRLTLAKVYEIALSEYIDRNRVLVTIAGPEYIDGGKK